MWELRIEEKIYERFLAWCNVSLPAAMRSEWVVPFEVDERAGAFGFLHPTKYQAGTWV